MNRYTPGSTVGSHVANGFFVRSGTDTYAYYVPFAWLAILPLTALAAWALWWPPAPFFGTVGGFSFALFAAIALLMNGIEVIAPYLGEALWGRIPGVGLFLSFGTGNLVAGSFLYALVLFFSGGG